jgi:pilus assembly protein CpaE
MLMATEMENPGSASANTLSVALIGPHRGRREALMAAFAGLHPIATGEFAAYPHLAAVSSINLADYDVAIVDLDENPEQALEAVEKLCAANASVTVMVYARQADADLLVRSMRAGAREFLSGPLVQSDIAEALARASSRRQESRRQKKVSGKLLVFAGAKGGAGVTTIASNFAISLAKEGGGSVALADLDPALGDAAVGLGVAAQFTIVDALKNASRLDADFVSSLLAKHSSGLSVLSGPDKYNASPLQPEIVGKLLRILREQFAYVVVDAGVDSGQLYRMMFEMADTIYLVAQVSVPELRNSHRLISEYFGEESGSTKLEVVLNRFQARALEIDEAGITKALMRPAKWRIPNDYAAARNAQNTATPLALQDGPISRAIAEMAKAACGRAPGPVKKRRFALFG